MIMTYKLQTKTRHVNSSLLPFVIPQIKRSRVYHYMYIHEVYYINDAHATYEDPSESCPSRGNSRTLLRPQLPAGTSVVKHMHSMHNGSSIRY